MKLMVEARTTSTDENLESFTVSEVITVEYHGDAVFLTVGGKTYLIREEESFRLIVALDAWHKMKLR